MRQRELQRSKQFRCACELCTDALEADRCGEASCAASRAIAGGSICTKTTREQDRCGGGVSRVELTSHEQVVKWDDEQRARLASLLPVDGASSEQVEPKLRAFIHAALRTCHPNHAIVLQARLALVAFGFDDSDEDEAPGATTDCTGLQRKLHAATEALQLAERILPQDDPQKADLLFQMGCAQHEIAHRTMTAAKRQLAMAATEAGRAGAGVTPTTAMVHAAALEAARSASEATKAAADSFCAQCQALGESTQPRRGSTAVQGGQGICETMLGQPAVIVCLCTCFVTSVWRGHRRVDCIDFWLLY